MIPCFSQQHFSEWLTSRFLWKSKPKTTICLVFYRTWLPTYNWQSTPSTGKTNSIFLPVGHRTNKRISWRHTTDIMKGRWSAGVSGIRQVQIKKNHHWASRLHKNLNTSKIESLITMIIATERIRLHNFRIYLFKTSFFF